MKTKNLLIIIGIGFLLLFPCSIQAQIGTSENYTQTSTEDQEELNEQRLSDLRQQLERANDEVREARRIEREAKGVAKEAKAALRAEQQAQKARKQANAQAKKARNAMGE